MFILATRGDNVSMHDLIWSSKASATAQRTMFGPALMAFSAAPVPRPPQPTRPIFIMSVPVTCALRSGAVARAAAVVLRKARRDDMTGTPLRNKKPRLLFRLAKAIQFATTEILRSPLVV